MSFSVQEVAQLLKQAKENEKPYVFFTGAGCSISAGVPSATGLIKEIRTQFPIQVKNIDHEKDQFNYGKYMSVLDKDERRRLLKPHIIDNKNINWAHIALACLMESGYVQRVLTFNFDSILSRACNLLGLHPSIYDFATANPHLYHLINDPSIVHLHGQGTGFIQLNTKEETQDHTEKLGDFIAATLNSNPSLFIGYSGNADEFFPLLETKYSEQHRLIWTGRKENIDEIEAKSVKEFLKLNNNLTHYIGNIDVDHFLVQLAKELDCFPPELFSNPYEYLNQQLKNVQEYPLGDGLDILANLTNYLREQSKKPLTKSLYTAFIYKYPNKDATNGLSDKVINEIIWAYEQQARYLEKQEKFEESHKIYDQALSISKYNYSCLHNYALSLSNYANLKKDPLLFNKVFGLHDQATRLQPNNADNIGNYGLSFLRLACIYNNEELFNKAFEKFELALTIQKDHLNALTNYGSALASLADIKNDQALYEKAIEKLEKVLTLQPHDPSIIKKCAITLYFLSKITKDKTTIEKAIKYFEEYLKINSDDADEINNYAISLMLYADITQDIHIYDKALKQYLKALTYNPNDTYNLACYYAVKDNLELCKENFLHAEQYNTLPNLQHISQDQDLDHVRNQPWFTELLNRLKEKEETIQKAS